MISAFNLQKGTIQKLNQNGLPERIYVSKVMLPYASPLAFYVKIESTDMLEDNQVIFDWTPGLHVEYTGGILKSLEKKYEEKHNLK